MHLNVIIHTNFLFLDDLMIVQAMIA